MSSYPALMHPCRIKNLEFLFISDYNPCTLGVLGCWGWGIERQEGFSPPQFPPLPTQTKVALGLPLLRQNFCLGFHLNSSHKDWMKFVTIGTRRHSVRWQEFLYSNLTWHQIAKAGPVIQEKWTDLGVLAGTRYIENKQTLILTRAPGKMPELMETIQDQNSDLNGKLNSVSGREWQRSVKEQHSKAGNFPWIL
jgi:hypothetical protein